MNERNYRYHFSQGIPFREVEESLLLAVLAAECIHGSAKVRLDGVYSLEKTSRQALIKGDTEISRQIAELFTGFLEKQFGKLAFSVERVVATVGKS